VEAVTGQIPPVSPKEHDPHGCKSHRTCPAPLPCREEGVQAGMDGIRICLARV